MKPGEQSDVQYRLTNSGSEVLSNCQLELITPRDKIQIVKYEKVGLVSSEWKNTDGINNEQRGGGMVYGIAFRLTWHCC